MRNFGSLQYSLNNYFRIDIRVTQPPCPTMKALVIDSSMWKGIGQCGLIAGAVSVKEQHTIINS